MKQNIVIGNPLVNPAELLSDGTIEDWQNEFKDTLFTEERFLPRLLVAAGVAKSTSEVKRNKPELFKELNELDFLEIKWGKKRLFIIVGE